MIRGIDSQVMINKTVDYSRQMSNQMQEHENSKEFASQLQRSKVELQNKTVNQTNEAQDRRVDREKNEQDDQRDRRKRRKLHAARNEKHTTDDTRADEMTAREEALNRVPTVLPRSERSLGGSIDINV